MSDKSTELNMHDCGFTRQYTARIESTYNRNSKLGCKLEHFPSLPLETITQCEGQVGRCPTISIDKNI